MIVVGFVKSTGSTLSLHLEGELVGLGRGNREK